MTRPTTHRITLLTSATLALTMASAQAASPNVDAGALLRQTEQGIQTTPKASKRKPRKATPSSAASPSETTVQVTGFQFMGNRLLTQEELSRALASFQNRSLTLSQLREAADAITNVYREAGWTVRAFLPKQEIAKGVVTIQIVEAVFGGAQLQSATPYRVDAARLLDMAEANLVKGQPLHASQVDRTLLLLDDLPGVNVEGNLVAGQNDGETNLAISATDEALITGNASVDNHGSRSTGSERLSVNLNVNSPAQLGDLLSLNALNTQGSDYQRLSYSVPVGYAGWRAGVHASSLKYRVITSDFATLDPHGTATTSGLDISYPIARSQTQNVNLALSYDDKKFNNTSNSQLTSYGIRVYNAALNASVMDAWAGGGMNNVGLSLTSGDKSTDSRYTKLNLSASRLQTLNANLSLYVAASAQATDKNLDSSEKMYLGGVNGIRAYPSSEAGGSEGHTLTLELRQRVANNLTLTGFYDYGWIRANHDNHITPAADPNSYAIQGYGVSVAWQATQTVDVKATLAQRVGNNPAANTTTGMDGDGTKKITRLWLSTGISF